MNGFGDRLKEARESRGLTLEAVAAATRIRVRHLEALERSDVEALPAGPFAKGYIEACAKHLGIDPRPVLEAYRAEGRRRGLDVAETRDRVFEEFSQIVERRGPTSLRAGRWPGGRKALALLLVALGLGLGGWLLVRDRGAEDPTAPPVALGAPTSDEVATPPTTPPAPGEGSRARVSDRHPHTTSVLEGEAAEAEPPAPEPTPDVAAPSPNPDMRITASGVGTGIENYRLVGGGDRFPEGSEVVFWTNVVGGEAGNVIHHVWLQEGRGIARIALRIGSPQWRTFSRRRLPPGAAGSWVAEARDIDGRLLARQEFLCVAALRGDAATSGGGPSDE